MERREGRREGERERAPLTALGAGEAAEVVDLVQSEAPRLHTYHWLTTASTVPCRVSKKYS